jgi:TonB family protein
MTAIFWFHPLVWLASFELRREAEGAVDDCVLANGVAPSDYAGRLLDVARQLRGLATPAAVIPMVRRSELERRVRLILDPARPRASAGFLVRCAIVLAAVALVLPIAVTRQRVYAQGKVYKISNGVSQPTVIYKQEPQYTEEAKDEKIEGTVILEVEISTTGHPENVRVRRGLGYGLDQNAITAIENWVFKPGMKDGQPVAVYATIQMNFHLL